MRIGAALGVLALLSSCGGGGSGGGTAGTPSPPAASVPTPPPPPPPSSTACSLSARQQWAEAQLDEWYLFPETLPANRDPGPYATVTAYIDYLTATARAQGRDRFFTYLTSIAEENAFFSQGANAGFGIRLSIDVNGRRVFVTEAFEGAPALAAGIDRGTEILAIGPNSANLRTVSDIIAAEGSQGVIDALGPSTPGTVRAMQVTDSGGTRTLSIAKADYALQPVSPRYGAQVIDNGGTPVGYLNLRTFISTADPQLRDAFADFRAQGITHFIVDFRYNGGGLVSIAQLMGDLLGGNRSTGDVFSYTTFRASKSSNNETRRFQPTGDSVSPVRIAFIGTGGTASASELVINSFIPYLGNNLALIGDDTYGKPVGQIAEDRAACDDRLRIVAFRTENANHQGDYYNGLANAVGASCQAGDDISFPLGDPGENSVQVALDFLAGNSCTPISGAITARALRPRRRELLRPLRPNAAQNVSPGIF